MLCLTIFLFSCDKDDQKAKPESLIVGKWEHTVTIRGSEHVLSSLGPEVYEFESDKSFIRKLGTFDWRDEGTWNYQADTRSLDLEYRTISTQITEPKLRSYPVEEVSTTKLVFKIKFDDVNTSGEYVEYEYRHYTRK